MKCIMSMVACALMSVASATAQTTVTFKPGPAAGQDAYIFALENNCVLSGETTTPANKNYGNGPDLNISAWTYNGAGCGQGTTRSMIRFDGLNTIPPAAIITSAKLLLYTPAAPTPIGAGNNYYPGTPLPNTNPGWVKRVLPGAGNPSSLNNWNEQTVIWNSAQSIGVDPNGVAIPVSGANYSWTVPPIDVTAMVQAIVTGLGTDPYANNGFMLQLETEVRYRSQLYASSDAADSTIWPALQVTYVVCNPGFSFCANTVNPFDYTFTANNTAQNSFSWVIDGTAAGNTASINANLAAEARNVCLNVVSQGAVTSCKRCLRVCPGDNPQNNPPCNGDFRFCSNSVSPYTYTFTGIPGQSSYSWTLDNTPIGNTATITYSFPQTNGYYTIGLNAVSPGGTTCTRYLRFCVKTNSIVLAPPSREPEAESPVTVTGTVLRGDDIVMATHAQIVPNPTKDGWHIQLNAAAQGTVQVNVYDITGRLLNSATQTVTKGSNALYQDARDYPAGIYYLEIKGADCNIKEKAVKEQ